MQYGVIAYANRRGVRAVVRIVDLCQRDLVLSGLPKAKTTEGCFFYDFKGKREPQTQKLYDESVRQGIPKGTP